MQQFDDAVSITVVSHCLADSSFYSKHGLNVTPKLLHVTTKKFHISVAGMIPSVGGELVIKPRATFSPKSAKCGLF